MPADDLLDLARQCRVQATLTTTKKVAKTLRKMADEYEARANVKDAAEPTKPIS
jgi:hypothetical protein